MKSLVDRPVRPAPTAAADLTLRRGAARVLLDNWTGASTVPSRTLYPHQWSWDSAFVAVGLRHLSARRAQRELESLLAGQWADGRIPHIVFNPEVPHGAYFPSPDFWQSSGAGREAGAPSAPETSGIVQPPVHALAAWLVHRADPAESRRRGFLARVQPRLTAWHDFLLNRRDLGGGGLAAVVHPWEPGMDNSPCWDRALRRVEPAPPSAFRRADLDHGHPADRPTDLDYGRYVRLAADYREAGYDDRVVRHGFAVEDPCFNALLIVSELALAAMARELGLPHAPFTTRAEALTRRLVARLWDESAGLFRVRDLHTDTLVQERGVTGLVPLAVPGLPPGVVRALHGTLSGPRFRAPATRLVPSYDLTGPAFDAQRYWRGPAWFNTAWLIHRGLRAHGLTEDAEHLRRGFLTQAAQSDFAEYVDPVTGEGRGTRRFSWTAALALDLLCADPEEPAS
ncbi:trehalase family glycosidase [Streptomyces sp. DH24]|uniref:MGH1-like glycoside hydrolase domain-containing protein n=1 Tax=Streptomyces sp. DH24 TaxID=3040123 RepID=UPI0024435819|nr:trehalase family glycosidase [Streptomyces sp. DH24]MDG9720050.1 trehalase family glycosidase [Streptomyces sp. DH24]